MVKLVSIDPGKYKSGLVLAETSEKKVYRAIILKSEFLEDYVRKLNAVEDSSKFVVGNGTTRGEGIKKLDFVKKYIFFKDKLR